jgi:hypothetical protein
MKKLIEFIIFAGVLFLTLPCKAQTDDWKTEKTDDGKVTVISKVSEWTNKNGDTYPLIEYTVVSTDILNYKSCISVMRNVAKHDKFLDVKTCEKTKTFSDNEWLNYYVFKAPWPFPSTDCVVKVNFSEDTKMREAVFTMIAAPNMMKVTDLKRFELYNFTYTFKELVTNKIEVTITSKMALTTKVPLFMLRASFPTSAAEPLQKLIKLIKDN